MVKAFSLRKFNRFRKGRGAENIQTFKRGSGEILINNLKKSGVALTQHSLTLHYSKRIFYKQHYIHI